MDDALYRTYHDEEWGVPEYDDGNSSRNLCWMASKPDSPGVPFYTKENPSVRHSTSFPLRKSLIMVKQT